MDGKCRRCSKREAASGMAYCPMCICELVEKRAQKAIPDTGGKKEVIITCKEKNSLNCITARHVLRKIFGRTAKISVAGSAKAGKSRNALWVIPDSADDAAAGLISSFMSAKPEQKTFNPGIARIFEFVTEKELLAYARARNLKNAATGKHDGGWIKASVQKLQEGHSGIIEAMAKAGVKLKELE